MIAYGDNLFLLNLPLSLFQILGLVMLMLKFTPNLLRILKFRLLNSTVNKLLLLKFALNLLLFLVLFLVLARLSPPKVPLVRCLAVPSSLPRALLPRPMGFDVLVVPSFTSPIAASIFVPSFN